jgi:septum formation protein
MTALILASASETRRRILAAADVSFEAYAPNVDEASVKTAFLAEGATPDTIAAALAEQKALRVAGRHPDAVVLGCDQVLVCDGRVFDKAGNMAAAREVLCALRDKRHELITAVVLVRGAEILWHHSESASLWMRHFSDAFLDRYLVDEGVDILSAVGCYRIEGRGAQLFARVEGDQFAIRGLPLIPLLHALRKRGLAAT